MPIVSGSLDQLVISLVPSLSKSLAEQFNVFRVMHHGTHEKQLSNVFAWLLRADATHELGDVFQRIFVEEVNRSLSAEDQLFTSGYRVIQEVNTFDHEAVEMDIADVVLASDRSTIVIENFESSDGHGHSYHQYLSYGAKEGRRSVVVLLCARRDMSRLTDGWEQAAVVTYAELLEGLQAHIQRDRAWQRTHSRQAIFINEMFEHFVEGPRAVSNRDRIAFIKAMCDSGESARYGYRPQERAAQEFAELLARHAQHQFEEGRRMLAEVKSTLVSYARERLTDQVNSALPNGYITSVHSRFSGQWEWCVTLDRANTGPNIFLEFGPTAVVENMRVPEPLPGPDYTKIFVTRASTDGIDRIVQSPVGIDDVLTGLSSDDTRLRDAIIAAIAD